MSARVEGIPLASPEGWAIAYHLLGRHGADRARVARLLGELLPTSLAARLAAMLTSSIT